MLSKKALTGLISIVGFFVIQGTAYAELDVSKFKTPKEFKGTVKALSSTIVRMGLDYGNYKGFVNYVVPPGTFFLGPIFDSKGNIIKPGDVLVTMEKEVCEALVDQAEADLDTKESHYKRCQKIITKGGEGIISKQAFLEAKNNYLVTKAELLLAQKRLETCTYNAQFDGMVNEVLFPGGYTSLSDREVMTVSQLVPIGVEIEMSREEAFSYGMPTPIAIFPVGHDKPIGPFRGGGRVSNSDDKQKLTFIVQNYQNIVKTKKLKTGQVVPVVSQICPVVPFYHDDPDAALSVYENSVLKDEKGSYVMLVEGQNCTEAINPVFKLKKVYITTADELTSVETSIKYIKLKDAAGLKINNTLLTAQESKDLKDGDIVYFQKSRYLFLPGDIVKVVLDSAVTNESRGLEPGNY